MTAAHGDMPPRAPRCPADRVAYALDSGRTCDGPATYYCDELVCGRVRDQWDGVRYVVDRDGDVWQVVRGGIVVRVVEERHRPGRVVQGNVTWLERELGPLLPFDPVVYRRTYPRAEVPS